MEEKEIYAFPKVISKKVNIIAWLEFQLVYYDFSVQDVIWILLNTWNHTIVIKLFVLDRNI